MKLRATHILLLALMGTTPAIAKDNDVARPQVYTELVGCKTIADSAARLACYDAAAAKMQQAADAKDIVILDRAEVRKTKRSLFGFLLPKLPFFDNDQEDEFTTIETTFSSVTPVGYGKYQFTIPEGAVWETTEPTQSVLREGRKVKIKRGAIGGFLMQVGNGGYVRVKRVS
ncbi:MAG: hypothetical protein IBJ12_02310 [Sphingomonadaceae bacterium]|nr:hypothetical protein [Sphingomonadaceae bacterium]